LTDEGATAHQFPTNTGGTFRTEILAASVLGSALGFADRCRRHPALSAPHAVALGRASAMVYRYDDADLRIITTSHPLLFKKYKTLPAKFVFLGPKITSFMGHP
jgi:hypothetical protein